MSFTKLLKGAEWVAIASVVIIIAWLLILQSGVSDRIKRIVTAAVVVSPIPPIP